MAFNRTYSTQTRPGEEALSTSSKSTCILFLPTAPEKSHSMSTTRPANTLCQEEICDAVQTTLHAPVPVYPRADRESYLRLCRWIQDEEQTLIDE